LSSGVSWTNDLCARPCLALTNQESALEHALHDKVEQMAGKKAADNKQVKMGIEKIADAVGDKVPTSMLGAGALASLDGDKKDGGDGASDLMGAAAGFLGKK
jgi:hypothetical protein